MTAAGAPLAVVAAIACATPAAAFEQSFAAPAFVVSVPRLPDVAVGAFAAAPGSGQRVARGSAGGLAVEVSAREAGEASSTRGCAGASLREIVARPGMPSRDNIYRAPFDASTFLVLYLLEVQGVRQLHAHLLAAVQGTHCVDAHFQRAWRAGEDLEDWRAAFAGAAVRSGPR